MDVGRRREADGGMEGFGYWEVLLDVERPREADGGTTVAAVVAVGDEDGGWRDAVGDEDRGRWMDDVGVWTFDWKTLLDVDEDVGR